MIYRLFFGYSATFTIGLPSLPPTFCIHLSAFFLETTSLPLRCHSITIQLPSNTFPVPCHLSSARRYPAEYINILLLSRLVVECSIFSLSISPVFLFKYLSQSLFPLKICTSANFVVPLQSIPTLEGDMSCEKRFAKGLSWVGFGHIKIAFIALCV